MASFEAPELQPPAACLAVIAQARVTDLLWAEQATLETTSKASLMVVALSWNRNEEVEAASLQPPDLPNLHRFLVPAIPMANALNQAAALSAYRGLHLPH